MREGGVLTSIAATTVGSPAPSAVSASVAAVARVPGGDLVLRVAATSTVGVGATLAA